MVKLNIALFTLGVLKSDGRAKISSSGIWEPVGTVSDGRVPLKE